MSDWNRLRLDDCPEENEPIDGPEDFQEDDEIPDIEGERDFWQS